MTLGYFISVVKKMRAYQSSYERTKSYRDLTAAKFYAQMVDDLISEHEDTEAVIQTTFF